MNFPELNTIMVASTQRIIRQGITSFTINNYATTKAYFTNQGVKRELPPAQLVDGVLVPIPFPIDNSGITFNIDITIDFPNKTGKIIIDYFQIKEC